MLNYLAHDLAFSTVQFLFHTAVSLSVNKGWYITCGEAAAKLESAIATELSSWLRCAVEWTRRRTIYGNILGRSCSATGH